MANAKLDVDIASFQANINAAKNVLKGLSAEMKATDAEFKATGNAEKQLADKTKTLNSQLQVQKGIADQAKQALKAMDEAGVKPTDADYQKLYATMMNATSGMNEAQAALNGLGTSAQEAASGADQLTDSVNSIGKKISLEQVIGGIDKITSGLENAAKKAVQLGEAIWNNVMDSARLSDDILTQAGILDMTPEQYQKYKGVFNTIGEVTISEWAATKRKIEKAMVDPSSDQMDVFRMLGLTGMGGKESNTEILNIADNWEDVFWQVGSELQKRVESGEMSSAMADVYGEALFGKKYSSMKNLLKLGQEGFEAALNEQNIISDEALEKNAALNDAVIKLQDSFDALKAEVTSTLAPALTEAATALDGLLGKLLEYLKTEEGQKMLKTLSKSVSDLFSGIKDISVSDVVNGFKDALDGLVSGLQWIIDNKDTLIGALEAIVAGWAGLKITGGLLTIVQMINGLKDLGFGGGKNNPTGQTTGTTGTTVATGTTENVMLDPKMGQAAATSIVLGSTWDLIKNADVFKNGDLSEEDQIKNWVSEQVEDGFIDAGKSDEITEKNLKMFEILKEHGKDADIPVSVVPETSDGAAEDIAAQVGPVVLPVQLSFGGGGIGGGGGGGMVDILSKWFTPRIFANGIHSVPYDGMLARLHKGERVMPAREIQSRSYNSNLYVESMYMNNGTDAAGLASAMAAAQQRTMSGYGS